jgi:hypothetical protein
MEYRKAVGSVVGIRYTATEDFCPPRPYSVEVRLPSVLASSSDSTQYNLFNMLYFRERPKLAIGDKVTVSIQIGDE